MQDHMNPYRLDLCDGERECTMLAKASCFRKSLLKSCLNPKQKETKVGYLQFNQEKRF